MFEIAPQGNRQTPCERHDTDAPQSFAGAGKPLVEPVAELAAGLEAQPAPRKLDHQPSASPVARLADTQFERTGTAGIWRRRQVQAAGHFPTVVKQPPAKQFPLRDIEELLFEREVTVSYAPKEVP